MSKPAWYSVLNRSAAAPLEIMLYGDIGCDDLSAASLITVINAAGQRPIRVRINSDGGSVSDGTAIYNALANHPGGVEVDIEGWACSIASYIAMAGKPVRMAENGLLMIHNASAIVMGDASEMQSKADLLTMCNANIAAAYAKKTGLTAKRIAEMMDAETWLTAAEAKEMGFVDEVTSPLRMAAHFDTRRFLNPPNPQNSMKILTKPVASLLASLTGVASLTEDSTEAEVQNALNTHSTSLVQIRADLAASQGKVTDLTGQLANLTTERDTVRTQFTELTNSATLLRTDLTTAQGQVTNLTTERDGLQGKLTTSAQNVTRLESLCKVKGIDPATAVPQLPEPTAKLSIAVLDAEMKAAGNNPVARAAVTKKINDAAAKGLLTD